MRPKRALWLLDHTTLRAFEVPLLQSLGFEVFLPKSFPSEEDNVSASVTFEFDGQLSIPALDLVTLNTHNFYDGITPEIGRLLNEYFDLAIFGFFPNLFKALVREFSGTLILRPFGLSGLSYTDLTAVLMGRFFLKKLEKLEHRFWFGQAYENLSEIESGIYQRKAVTLPIGLANSQISSSWTGVEKRILFVCPRIKSSGYYGEVYKNFLQDFGDLPHIIGGAQPIPVPDSRILGFMPRNQYDDIMRSSRLMFYHSREPRHLHYHPLEAIRSGMPLLFMSGGMLDNLGGNSLPGRCVTVSEARSKAERLLAGDRTLTNEIISSQPRLLDAMSSESCAPVWRKSMARIEACAHPPQEINQSDRPKKVAVIVPIKYRGGSMRGAKLLARAIDEGARDAGDPIQVIFAHIDEPGCYEDDEFDDLPATVTRRPFHWRLMLKDEARRAAIYAGLEQELIEPIYCVPDDGIQQFTDCDLFVIISDRLDHPLLPIRPYLLMVYDYLQRYVKFLDESYNRSLVRNAQKAEAIMVTTEFTSSDAVQFAGIDRKCVKVVPMLAPQLSSDRNKSRTGETASNYFLWTTNISLHKNHKNAFKALRLYYEEYDGRLECRITGSGAERLLKGEFPHLVALHSIISSSPKMKRLVKPRGELHDKNYREMLAGAAFLWHPALIDNGTFSVIEAADFGVSSLSSDYPAMREIDKNFGLNLTWMDPNDPGNMATQLKAMELNVGKSKIVSPFSKDSVIDSGIAVSGQYWSVIKEHL